VQAGVDTHVRALGKALPAIGTGKWLFASVRALVLGEVVLQRECLAACGALVRPLPGVRALVLGES
jgi:hypothetical protein